MAWIDQIFRYCERGLDGAFWAEPLNAVTNAAFIVAAVAAAAELRGRPVDVEQRIAVTALAGLVFVIGVGSFLFHTFATRWAAVADTAPIGLFMLAYLAYALRAYLGWGWIAMALGLVAFVAALQVAGGMECGPGPFGFAAGVRGPCFNGTIGYVPAFLAMAIIGGVLIAQRHPAGPYLVAAAAVFLVSMVFRSIDLQACAATRLIDRPRGTHFLWHLLNATTLYLLLRAAIRAAPRSAD